MLNVLFFFYRFELPFKAVKDKNHSMQSTSSKMIL